MASNYDIRVRALGVDTAANEIKTKIPAAAKSAGSAIKGAAGQGQAALTKLSSGAQNAEQSLTGVATRANALKGVLASMAAGAATVGLNQITSRIIKLGQDFQESENLVKESFGGMTDAANKWSAELQKTLGLNGAEARRQAATFNVMFNSMGLGEQQAFGLSTSLAKLAYDMASFYNLSPEEAFEKLRAGITGEAEPLKRLGVLLNETTVKAYAMKNGIGSSGEELTEQQKVLARYGLIMQQTQKAQGDLARTMDSGANVARTFGAQIEMASTTAGKGAASMRAAWQSALLPIIKRLNEGEGSALKFAGAATEVGTQVANIATPLGTAANLLFQYRQMTALSTLATRANTIAVATEGNAAAVSAGKFNILAAAKARAAGLSLAGLTGAAAVGVGAAAVGATAYGGTKAVQGMNDRNLSDSEVKKRHGILGSIWAKGGAMLGNSWIGEILEGGGFGHVRRGQEAERKALEMSARSRKGGAVSSQVAGMALTAAGESTTSATGKTKTGKKTDAQRKAESEAKKVQRELEKKAVTQKRLNAILAARNVDLGEVDIDELNDKIAITTDAATKAGLMELKRRATKYQSENKKGEATAKKGAKEKSALQERIAQSEIAIGQTIIEERFALAAARLEAMKGSGKSAEAANAKIDFQLAQLEAQKLKELAALEAKHSDSFAESGGLKIAGLKAQGILARAAIALKAAGGGVGSKTRNSGFSGALGEETTYMGRKYFGSAKALGLQGLGTTLQARSLGAGLSPLAGSGRRGNRELTAKMKSREYTGDGQWIKIQFEPLLVPNTAARLARARR